MSLTTALIGKEINGYLITECIGEGGMALVFRAESVITPKIVRAFKIIRPELMDRALFVERFTQEATLLEQFHSPHVISFHSLRKARDLLVMELEYVDGYTLGESPYNQQVYSYEQVVEWLIQASTGLSHIHQQGVIHRDMKPSNLLIDQSNRLKIIDLGIAQNFDRSMTHSSSKSSHVLGSPAYMAPEVCQGETPTFSSDIYALGLIGYQLLLGSHPLMGHTLEHKSNIQLMLSHFKRSPSNHQLASLNENFENILKKSVAKNSNDRYQHADELLQALLALKTEGKTSTPLSELTYDQVRLQEKKIPKLNVNLLVILLSFSFLVNLYMSYDDVGPLFNQLSHYLDKEDKLHPFPLQWIGIGQDVGLGTAAFEISRSEITVDQYRECIDDGVCTTPKVKDTDQYGECSWGKANPNAPINCVTFKEAQTFAQWVGGSIPTIEEWRAAAWAKKSKTPKQISLRDPYPWGQTRPSCAHAVMYNDGPACGGVLGPRTVCSKHAGHSGMGICDLSGNLREWINRGVDPPSLMGGGWFSDAQGLRITADPQIVHTLSDPSVGFRVIRKFNP